MRRAATASNSDGEIENTNQESHIPIYRLCHIACPITNLGAFPLAHYEVDHGVSHLQRHPERTLL